jgi:hypothetical protein
VSAPAGPLGELAGLLRSEGTPVSAHVAETAAEVAAGSPASLGSFVLDAVREGYLLHYGEPRLIAGQDDDLALLAGDYLYALGIERLAADGDTAAVLELADLIAGCARLHAEGRGAEAEKLWRVAATALGDSSGASQ